MSSLNAALFEALGARFPSVTVSQAARFLPMFDLSKGELSSTAAIEIAREMRGDARAIAGEIVRDLSPKPFGSWKIVAGYMVLSDASNAVLMEEAALSDALSSIQVTPEPTRRVLCLVPDATSPVYARLRLIACAAVQALLAVAYEGRCDLGFNPEESQIVSSAPEVVALVVQAVERCFRHESERRVECQIKHEAGANCSAMTVWTSHHYHDRLSAEVKRAFVDARLSGVSSLRIPGDGWLLSKERALSELLSAAALEKVIRRLSSEEQWIRWIHHFASSIPSGDLDPSVALYDECASPRWGVQALYQRVSQLGAQDLPGEPRALREILLKGALRERALAIRALFLPALTARAVAEGDVVSWSAVVQDFAAIGHLRLNSPHYRAALREGGIGEHVVQINAGLALGLAAILPAFTEV
jgi:hypothetical protein